jgi:hypothetical protein
MCHQLEKHFPSHTSHWPSHQLIILLWCARCCYRQRISGWWLRRHQDLDAAVAETVVMVLLILRLSSLSWNTQRGSLSIMTIGFGCAHNSLPLACHVELCCSPHTIRGGSVRHSGLLGAYLIRPGHLSAVITALHQRLNFMVSQEDAELPSACGRPCSGQVLKLVWLNVL